MCEFISWIEKNGEVLFLTTNDIFNTKRGKELQKYTTPDDYVGHGAIRFYYNNFTGGKDCECTDFSTPDNFPPQIVSAIKKLQFIGLGTPELLLSKPARAAYEAVKQPTWATYKAVEQPTWATFKAVKQQARATFKAVEQQARATFKAVEQQAFWKLFKVKKNRNPAWR